MRSTYNKSLIDAIRRRHAEARAREIVAEERKLIHRHETRPVWVLADIDIGIADFVEYLNTIDGVRTLASCQGTIGEGGTEPYHPYVMCAWTSEAVIQLKKEFIVVPDGDGTWGMVHRSEDFGEHAMSGYRLDINNEEGAIIIDALILEINEADRRKRINGASTSDIRVGICQDLIVRLNVLFSKKPK